MSRRKHRGTKTVVVERAAPARQPHIKPGAVNFRPVTDKVVNEMYQHLGPQANQGYMYIPGAPIKPVRGITPPGGPRQWEYMVGYNIAQLPRSTETYSFTDLRSLASMYYGIQICQQVWYDYISKLELVIEPRPDLLEEDRDVSQYKSDIEFYRNFFAYPDRDRDLHSWLQQAVRDQLEIDAVAIYVRKDRLGRPFALELIDGATIKPLINDRGRKPEPGFPAYEQFVYGVPACFLTSDDLIYIKETERTDSVYGISRVEKIILNINVALRKQTKDLARFTDGTVPQGVLIPSVDVNWSQEEIEAYEIQFNNLLAGSDEQRARIKVLPRGFTYEKTDDDDIHVDLDTYLLNITASTYGLTMAELAFTADVNRSTGEMQENVVYRRAMGPLMTRYAKLFTNILHKYFKEDRFIVRFAGFGEVEDFRARAQAYATLTQAAIISPSRAAHELNLPVDVDLPSPILQTKTGPILLEDLASPDVREAQKQALIQAGTPSSPSSGSNSDDSESNEEELADIEPAVNDLPAKEAPKHEQAQGEDTSTKSQPTKKTGKKGAPATKRSAEDLMAQLTGMIEQLRVEIRASRKSAPFVMEDPDEQDHTESESDNNDLEDQDQDTNLENTDYDDSSIDPDSYKGSTRADKKEEQQGIMVAFPVFPEMGKQLVLPGGEPLNELHVTLAYLGNTQNTTIDTTRLIPVLQAFASQSAPLMGKTGGLARFAASTHSDGKSPIVALVNVPGLQTWRAELVKCIEATGTSVAHDFDYTPHITLTYIAENAPMPINEVPIVPLSLTCIELCIGNEITRIPLGLPPQENHEQRTQENTESVSCCAGPCTCNQSTGSRQDPIPSATQMVESQHPGPDGTASEREISAEYRRWRRRAIEDIKAGKAQRGFTTTLIAPELHTRISRALQACQTIEAVRQVFDEIRTTNDEPMVSKQGTCQCETCRNMAGKPINGKQPPYHDGCDCAAVPRSQYTKENTTGDE